MEILQDLQESLPTWALDLVRLSIWLMLLMMIFVPLERLFAVHPQRIFRKSLPLDLAYYFLNNLLPKALLVIPVALIAWVARHAVPAHGL